VAQGRAASDRRADYGAERTRTRAGASDCQAAGGAAGCVGYLVRPRPLPHGRGSVL